MSLKDFWGGIATSCAISLSLGVLGTIGFGVYYISHAVYKINTQYPAKIEMGDVTAETLTASNSDFTLKTLTVGKPKNK